MTGFTKLEVGKPSPFPAKPNFDGAHFEADQRGFLFLIYLSAMNSKERRALKSEIIRSRVLKDDNKLLTLIKFGTSDLIFELSFDPNLYKDNRSEQINKVNTVQVVGIDSRDNTLQALRLASVPKNLLGTWRDCFQSAKEDDSFSKKYGAWLDQLYSRHSVLDLWNVAENTGTFGR